MLNVIPAEVKETKSKNGKGVKSSGNGKRSVIHDSQVPSTSGESSNKIRKIEEFLVPVPIGHELDKKTKEESSKLETKDVHVTVPQGFNF